VSAGNSLQMFASDLPIHVRVCQGRSNCNSLRAFASEFPMRVLTCRPQTTPSLGTFDGAATASSVVLIWYGYGSTGREFCVLLAFLRMFAVGEDGELPGDLGKHDPKLIEAVCNEVGTRIHVWIGSRATGVFSSHTWLTACQSVLLSKDCVGAGVWFCYNRCVATDRNGAALQRCI
jgi:hypothetical protein